MGKGKRKNLTNRNQGYLASSEPSSPTTARPGYTNTLKKQGLDLKSQVIEDFEKDINNTCKEIHEPTNKHLEVLKKDINESLKEIQENTDKQLEALKEETQKSLEELQENTIIQMKEMNKTIQDLNVELGTIKKLQNETALELENLGKKSEVIDASITNRITE